MLVEMSGEHKGGSTVAFLAGKLGSSMKRAEMIDSIDIHHNLTITVLVNNPYFCLPLLAFP